MEGRYLKHKYLPPRLPVGTAALYWLLLDRFDAPGWMFGVLWTLVSILAIAFIARIINDTPIDL